jgi:hypothetical protein
MIKNYKLFTESKKEELNFDLLESMSIVYSALLKIVEVHEKHYYNDNKIISDEKFKEGINKLLKSCLDRKEKNNDSAENFIRHIKKCENRIYNKNLFKLDEEGVDESMFSIIDDLIMPVWSCLYNNGYVGRIKKEAEHILKNINDEWIYQGDFDYGYDDDDDDDDDDDLLTNDDYLFGWKTEKEFKDDVEGYIGKKFDYFDYSDKLSAYKYIENKPDIKKILDSEAGDWLRTEFLEPIKDLFGL